MPSSDDFLPSADLHARLHALEAQLQAQQQVMTFFTDAPAAYLLLNATGQIEAVNVQGCALLQRTTEELIGRRFETLLTQEAQDHFQGVLALALNTAAPQHLEAQLQLGSAPSLPVTLDLAVLDVGDQPSQVRLTVTKALKAAQLPGPLPASPDVELETVIMTFIQQLQRPLARAMNFMAVLRRVLGLPSSAVLKPLGQMEKAILGIMTLTASVERYMRVRNLRGHIRTINLQRVWHEVLRDAQPLMMDRQIQVTSDPLPVVQGDSQALVVILGEYLNNALKFTKEREEARIHLHLRETETDYHLGLADNGTGFNPQQTGRLFQMFGRLHPSQRYEGSGVGLASARRVAEHFGGRVWAEGQMDVGATFWAAWPKDLQVHANERFPREET